MAVNSEDNYDPEAAKDAVSRILGGYTPPRTTGGSTRYGQMPFSPPPEPQQEAAPPLPEEKADPVLQGGINALTLLIRGVTSPFRGVTNAISDVVPYANSIASASSSEERSRALSNLWNIPKSFQKGFNKGVLYSFMVPGEESQEKLKVFGGNLAAEGAYDVINTPSFQEARQNLPGLAAITSEEEIGRTPAPKFTEWDPFGFYELMGIDPDVGMPITTAGITATGWDIFADPVSYVTLGLGGAVRGVGRGIAAATEKPVAKALSKGSGQGAETLISPKNMPRPYYAYSSGKAARANELASPANVKYDILNTSIPMYILKEMGRGFKESHLRALARATSRSAARAARLGLMKKVSEVVAERTEQGVATSVDDILLEILPFAESDAVRVASEKLSKVGVKNDLNVDSLLGQVRGGLRNAAENFGRKEAEMIQELISNNAAKIAERAAKDEVPFIEAATYEVMDRFAREAEVPTYAIRRTSPSKYQTGELEGIAAALGKAGDGQISKEDLAQSWDAFVADSDETTVRAALETLLSPIGARTEQFKKGAAASRAAQAAGTKDEVVAAGRKGRVTSKLTASPEMKEMKKRLRMSQEDVEGAKSEAVAKLGRGNRILSDAEILDSPRNLLSNIASRLFPGKKINVEALKKQLLENPQLVTGEILSESIDYRLAGHRLKYLAERDVATPTGTFTYLKHLEEKGYNPLTATSGRTKLNMFATSAKAARAGKGDIRRTTQLSEIINLSQKASSQWLPSELTPILEKLGLNVKMTVLESADSANAVEELMHAAWTGKFSARYRKELGRLLTERYGDVRAAELVKVSSAKNLETIAGFEAAAKDAALAGLRLSDEEVREGISAAVKIKEEQILAVEKLQKLGVNPLTPVGRRIVSTLSNRSLTKPQTSRTGAVEAKKTALSTKQLNQLTEIKSIVKPGPIEGRVSYADIAVPISRKLQAIKQQTPETKALIEEIREVLRSEATRLKGVRGTSKALADAKDIKEVMAKIGNKIAAYELRAGRGSVAGFDFVFARRGGQYDKQGILSFMARGYEASRAGDGVFADYIDKLLGDRNLPLMSTGKNHKERAKLADSIFSDYTGEGLDAPLLMSVIRRAEKRGGGGGFVPDNGFVEDVNRMLLQFNEEMKDELAPIFAPNTGELGLRSGFPGWIDRLRTPREQEIAKEAISKYESPTAISAENLAAANKRIVAFGKASPENMSTLNSIKGLTAKDGGFMATGKMSFSTAADIQRLISENKLSNDFGLKRVIDTVIGDANEAAGKKVAATRVQSAIEDIRPELVYKDELLASARRAGDRFAALDAVRARLLLGRQMMMADASAEIEFGKDTVDNVLTKLQKGKTAEGLAKEQVEFERILTGIDKKFEKLHPKPTLDVAERPIQDLINNGTPRDIVAKIRTIDPSQNGREWAIAIRHLLNMEGIDKPGGYQNYSQLIESYRTGVDLEPGEYNPATKKPVPKPTDVLEAIRLAGEESEISAAAVRLAQRKDIRKKNVIDLINKAEGVIRTKNLERAQKFDYLESINTAAAQEVRETVQLLPDTIYDNIVEAVLTTRLDWQTRNLGYRELLAMRSLGTAAGSFMYDRFEDLNYQLTTKTGRLIDSDKPDFGVDKGVYKKRSWESFTTYESDKALISDLADFAETKFPNWQSDDALRAKRAAWMDQEYMEIGRFRENVLMTNGIFPSQSISLVAGEARIAGLSKLIKGDAEEVLDTSVYLSHLDVMDILGPETRQLLFFQGRELAFPQTAVMPAARLLVAAVDELLESGGTWFSKEKLQILLPAMGELIVNAASRTSTSQFGKVSFAKLNEDNFADIVQTLVSRMASRDAALKLHDQHILNASVATKTFDIKAGEISEPYFDEWRKVADSPVASSGDKMQAALEFTENIQKLRAGEELGDPTIREVAALNMQMLLAAELGIDDFVVLNQAKKIANAGMRQEGRKALKEEAKKIKELQNLSSRERADLVAQAMADTSEARSPILQNVYIDNVAAKVAKDGKIEIEDQFDVFLEVSTNKAFYNHMIDFGDVGLSKLFADHKMENLRSLADGKERLAVQDSETFQRVVIPVQRKWQKLSQRDGVDYAETAFKKLQQIPSEVLSSVLINGEKMSIVAKNSAAELEVGGARELFNFAPVLQRYFVDTEPLVLDAAIDLWKVMGHLFGGGTMSKIARTSLPSKWVDQHIAMYRGGKVVDFVDEQGEIKPGKDNYGFGKITDPIAQSEAWREWDIKDPFQMAVGVNTALAHATKIPYAANEIMTTFGLKVSEYAKKGELPNQTLARAKGEGYVQLKPQQFLSEGRELMWFMDTTNYLYPADIAKQLGTYSKFMGLARRELRGLIGRVSQGLVESRKWAALQDVAKAFMTILRPGNWVMNGAGMTWANWMAGMTSPMGYFRAIKMSIADGIDVSKAGVDRRSLDAQMLKYIDSAEKDGLVIREATDPTKGDVTSVVIKGQKKLIAESDLNALYKELGGDIPTAQSRELDQIQELGTLAEQNSALSAGLLRKMYRQTVFKVGRAAAIRDDIWRKALWLDILQKNSWSDLKSGGKEALKIVDRYHPQMQGLSEFNQEVTRRLVLFFTWRAKTLGWVLMDLLDQPGKILAAYKLQYNTQYAMGLPPEYLGTSDIQDVPMRSYQQNSQMFLANGGMLGYSLANPAQDLLGSGGWLSGINFNTYDSPGTLAITNTLNTFENFLYSSTPLIGNAVLNWSQGRTSTGIDLMRNGVSATEDVPLYIEDIMSQLGWSAGHIALAQLMPEVFYKASWEGEPMAEIKKKQTRSFVSWALGIRPTEFDSVQNRQKALSEILSKIAELSKEKIGY